MINPSEKLDCILTYGFKNLSDDDYLSFNQAIYELLDFFGVKTLKMNYGPFRHGDVVILEQDESGIWIRDFNTNNDKICQINYDIPPNELFY